MAKTGLILSGGGANGPWQAGWLQGSAECGAITQVDVIVGTSTGALAAAWLGMYPPDQFGVAVTAYIDVLRTELTGSTKSIYLDRCRWLPKPLRYLVAALRYPSIGDDAPLRAILERKLDFDRINASGTKVMVNGVDLRAYGRVESIWWSTPELKLWHVRSSASFPGVFPPVEGDGGYWTDGGLVDMAGLGMAINQGCERLVAVVTRDPDRTVGQPDLGPKNSLAMDVGPRMLQLQLMHMLHNDLDRCAEFNSWIDKGWLTHPSIKRVELHRAYPGIILGSSLDFRLAKADHQIQQGRTDALEYWERSQSG